MMPTPTSPLLLALAVYLSLGAGPVTAAPAPADGRAVRVVVLPPRLSDPSQVALRQRVDDELRRGLARGRLTVVEPPAPLPDPCERVCLQQLGAATGSEHVLRAEISSRDRDHTIRLELVATRSGEVVASSEATCELCGLSELATRVADQAARMRSKLEALDERPAILVISSEPPGASVEIDGEQVGEAPLERSLVAGPHRVVVRRRGYHDVAQARTLVAGVREALHVPLRRTPQARRARALGWAALASSVALVGAGVGLLALAGRPVQDRCDGRDIDLEGRCRYIYTTAPAGGVLLAAGAILGATGVGLLVRTREPRPAARVQAVLGPTSIGLVGAF